MTRDRSDAHRSWIHKDISRNAKNRILVNPATKTVRLKVKQMSPYSLAIGTFLGLFGLLASPLHETSYAEQGPAAAELEAAIGDLTQHVDVEGTSAQWRQHLDLDELRTQLDRANEADPAAVASMLGRFARFTDGMKYPAVVRVRMGLENWLVELPALNADRLAGECLLAKEAFVPRTAADVRAARSRLADAVARLDGRLGDDAEADDWRQFLRWDDLQAELAADSADSTPDLAMLSAVYSQYAAGREGLGLVWFKDVRRTLGDYINMIKEADKPAEARAAIRIGYERLMDGLPEVLDRYRQTPTAEDAAAITGVLRWLDSVGQAPRLIRVIRLRLNRPNVFLQVSEQLLQAAINRPVDQTMPVRDVILGTNIYGTGHTLGQLTAELVACDDRAELRFTLRATTESDTIGYKGPVRIYSSTTVETETTKTLLVDDEHVWALPAESNVQLDSDIRCIRSKRGSRFVEKFARKQAARKKSQADCIATIHAERQANRRFDEEMAEFIERMNHALIHDVRAPLAVRGLLPEQAIVRSTDSALHAQSLQAGPLDLAAWGDPPAVRGEPDLVFRLHESAIGNLAGGALRGMKFDEDRLRELAADLLGRPLDDVRPDDSAAATTDEEQQDPLEITFPSAAAPISVVFDDNQIRLTVRAEKFVQDGKRREGLNVTVAYRIEPTDEGFKAVLLGEAEIFPPGFVPGGGHTLTLAQTATVSILKPRLSEALEAEFVPQSIVFSDEFAGIGRLDLVQWETSDGWLLMAWNRVPPKP